MRRRNPEIRQELVDEAVERLVALTHPEDDFYETNNYEHMFHEDLGQMRDSALLDTWYRYGTNFTNELDFDLVEIRAALVEVLRDPDSYHLPDFTRSPSNYPFSYEIGEDQGSLQYHELQDIVKGLTDEEIDEVFASKQHDFNTSELMRLLDNEKKSIFFVTTSTLYVGFSFHDSEIEDRVLEILSRNTRFKKRTAPDPTRVVYRWKDGFYVTTLKPEELADEGKQQGICVGNPRYGYAEAVAAGHIQILSMRTPSHKTKFTLEVVKKPYKIDQIKGKANRLPGFDPGQQHGSSEVKVDEVEKLVQLLTFMKIDPTTVKDLQPALLRLLEGKKPKENPRRNSEHCGFCRGA